MTLLFVDDERNILSSLNRLFRPQGYRILTALSGMVLSRDLMLNEEILLLSRGHRLSEAIIGRIYHMEESIDRDLEIYVLTDRED